MTAPHPHRGPQRSSRLVRLLASPGALYALGVVLPAALVAVYIAAWSLLEPILPAGSFGETAWSVSFLLVATAGFVPVALAVARTRDVSVRDAVPAALAVALGLAGMVVSYVASVFIFLKPYG